MKSKNISQYILGATVIICSLVLLGALTFALSGFPARKGGRKLEIDFHDATGIKIHSSVKYAGKSAGTVALIRYLRPEERLQALDPLNVVRVTVQLDEEVPTLPSDLTARLDAESLLGEKFVALTPGKAEAPPLSAGAIIQGGEVGSIDAVARSAQAAIKTVDEILTKLKGDYPALIPRLAELLGQGNSLLTQSSNLVHNADTTILSANDAVTKLKADYAELIPKLNALFAQARSIATNADLAMSKVNGLVERLDGVVKTNEGDVAKLVEELRVVSQNLKVVTTYAKTLSGTLAEKPSTLIWGRKKKDLPTEQSILESSKPVPIDSPKK
jgi:ABC-type transporter Mla subunit MlaD